MCSSQFFYVISLLFLFFSVAGTAGVVLLVRARHHRKCLLQQHELQIDRDKPTSHLPHFLAVMSHEIRTPLVSLLSIVRMLGNTPLDGMQRKLVDCLDHSSDALMLLVNQTLDHSLLQNSGIEVKQGTFDLRELLRNLTVMMESAAREKGLVFACVIDELLPCIVRGDGDRIRQILNNLLVNAIKFTDSGIVKLQVHAVQNPTGRDLVEFLVIDTGIGMSPAVQQQVFQPYRQGMDVQRRFGGAGLGLNISRDLARVMGGDITVESCEGFGSRFCFSVALVAAVAAVRDTASPCLRLPRPISTTKELTILVVDDAEINRLAARSELENDGHTVVLASSAEEAFEHLQEMYFDVVMMDLQLPGMDGVSAIRWIRKSEDPAMASVAIVACSAWMSEEQVRNLLESGADAVSLKPIRPDVVYAAMVSRVNQFPRTGFPVYPTDTIHTRIRASGPH